jgi:light-regulated signal transduction histidine kinase (bacteriophytochrome)
MRDLNSTLLVKTNVLLIQEKVDISRLLSEIIQKLLFEYPTKKINFTTDFSRINYFWSCRYYLFEVILQLMHSMIKYNTVNNEVNIAIASAIVDKNVIISVTDEITGLNIGGISNNILDVYKKLYQHLTGGGIKLFYAQAIAETLGGQLTVENDRKSKITFSITMPLGYDYLVN